MEQDKQLRAQLLRQARQKRYKERFRQTAEAEGQGIDVTPTFVEVFAGKYNML